jgi:ribosomal protein L20A (L18A)
MRTVQEIYDAIEGAVNELACSHGVRLDRIRVEWIETSNIEEMNQFQLRLFDIEGSMYRVDR